MSARNDFTLKRVDDGKIKRYTRMLMASQPMIIPINKSSEIKRNYFHLYAKKTILSWLLPPTSKVGGYALRAFEIRLTIFLFANNYVCVHRIEVSLDILVRTLVTNTCEDFGIGTS